MRTVSDAVVDSLILDLLLWLNTGDRTYEEVMDAWRTSCPKLTVWEDANDRGLITSEYIIRRRLIKVSSSGLALLAQRESEQAAAASSAT